MIKLELTYTISENGKCNSEFPQRVPNETYTIVITVSLRRLTGPSRIGRRSGGGCADLPPLKFQGEEKLERKGKKNKEK